MDTLHAILALVPKLKLKVQQMHLPEQYFARDDPHGPTRRSQRWNELCMKVNQNHLWPQASQARVEQTA
jgi:hypothetical protein